MEKIKCRNCEGEGSYEAFTVCSKPMSNCCGGCTQQVSCEDCDGTGIQEIDLFEEIHSITYNEDNTNEDVGKLVRELINEINEFYEKI